MDLAMAMAVTLFGMFAASTVYFFYKLERWSGVLHRLLCSTKASGPLSDSPAGHHAVRFTSFCWFHRAAIHGGPFLFLRRNNGFELW